MTDPADLTRHATFTPPAGGAAQAALAGARRRQHRRLVGAGSGGAVVAVVAVLLVLLPGGSGKPDTLGPALGPLDTPSATPPPLAPAVPAAPAAAPVPAPADAAGGGGGVAAGAGPALARPLESPQSSARPAAAAPAGPYREVRRAYVTGGAADDCAGTPKVVVAGRPFGVCSSASVARSGADIVLGLDVCVPDAAAEPQVLRFPHGREVLWTVDDGFEPMWRWGRGTPPTGAAHAVGVRPGDCVTWRTSWPGVDDRGEQLEAGRYRLVAQLTATDGTYRYEKAFEL